ncbi:MAG: penicillin-binding protein 2 [Neisseriaceae bacterium]|nr:MAG: penicillin-binding protein 2 [Neisseriaceae bacterium]
MLIQDNYKQVRSNQDKKKRRISENNRINLVLNILFLSFLAIFVRVAYFQMVEVPKWEAHGNNIYYRSVPVVAERGRIVDRNGVILAMNEPMRNVLVDPYQLPKFHIEKMKLQNKPKLLLNMQNSEKEFYKNLDQLAMILDQPKAKIYQVFDYRTYEGKSKGDRYLKRKVDKEVANKIKELNIPGIKITPVAERRYPDGNLFGQVIGVTKMDVDSNKNERIIGLEGLEYQFDKYLQGENGLRVMIQDNNGRYIDTVQSTKTKPVLDGKDLVLSIDKNIQSATMDTLRETVIYHKAVSGSAVVLDAKNGEVLAMVNYPDFDPARFTEYDPTIRRNYAVNDLVEPGSLFKPFIVAKVLDDGKVNPNTVIDTYPYVLSNHKITDTVLYPQLTVTGIITKSSNVGSSKLMSMLDSEEVYNYLSSIGIGKKPNSEFPGEAAGVFRNWRKWYPLDKATISYGYGVQMSILQLARAYTIFTNDGKLLTPTFLKLQGKRPIEERIIDSKTSAQMRDIMTTVTEPGGTGVRAAIPDFKVAGKSGTARKLVNGRYSPNSHVAMFAGYAPADNPRLIVVVSINNPRENGYYGGVVAAPAFKKIMSSSLSILGVVPTKQLVANKAANN